MKKFIFILNSKDSTNSEMNIIFSHLLQLMEFLISKVCQIHTAKYSEEYKYLNLLKDYYMNNINIFWLWWRSTKTSNRTSKAD